jgi:ribosomal RNA-processing protein 1
LVTLGREWLGIDQWRKDKYMMLVRRFLRQTLDFERRRDWADAQRLADLFSECVVSSTSRSSFSAVSHVPCDLEFRLHFVDVFLEELAKVGGEEMSQSVIRAFLKPFIDELKVGRESRLSTHIEERIFHHLMRQSDVGIAYEEGDFPSDDEEEVDGDDEEMEHDEVKFIYP